MVPASNDTGIQKIFPVTVQIYDTRFDRMMPKFFDMNLLKGRDVFTAKSMFQTVNNLFTAHSIRWDNHMTTELDKTIVNISCHMSVKTRAKAKNESIIVTECPCKILHNASGKASGAFCWN